MAMRSGSMLMGNEFTRHHALLAASRPIPRPASTVLLARSGHLSWTLRSYFKIRYAQPLILVEIVLPTAPCARTIAE